jgi:hypothetical protein
MNPTFATTLCFFLFAFTTFFPLLFTHAAVPVKDVNGDPVLPDHYRYFILPDTSTSGGELMLGKTKNAKCNLTIIQNSDHVGNGLPVTFTRESSGDFIFVDDTIDVELYSKPECAESSKWVIVEADVDYTTPWIGIHGIKQKLKDGWFKIDVTPLGSGYCLLFCFEVSNCYYVSRENDENGTRLVIVDHSEDVFGFVIVPDDAVTTGRRSVV